MDSENWNRKFSVRLANVFLFCVALWNKSEDIATLNVLKESGYRLRKKARTSIIISVMFLVALFVLGLTTDPYLTIALNWAEYTNFYAGFPLLLAFGAMRYYKNTRIVDKGFRVKVESRVISGQISAKNIS